MGCWLNIYLKIIGRAEQEGGKQKKTFLRQNYLDQVPGVETHISLLSADFHRLPQPTIAFVNDFGEISRKEQLCQSC